MSLAKAQPTPEILDTLVYNNKKILLNSDRTWNYFDSQINPNHYSFDTCVFNCMDHKQIFAYLSEKDKSSFKDKIHQYDTLKASVIPIKGPIYGIFTKHHQGVDIGLKKGEKISAVFDGKVRYAAYHKNGYGKLVIIRHYNGLETWYAHLSVIRVVEGQDVVAGDIIGLGGSTGRSKAPHLHFEIRYHDIPMDPLRKINFNNDYIVPKRALYSNMQDSLMEAPDTTASDSLIQMPVYVKDTLKAEVKKEKTNKEKANLHIVKKGDTLNNISKRYGTTIDRICELNNLKKEAILSIGQKIKIPK
ncbi:MAG: peptidoglycan DD-metalloendopeptidase family protein [Bacteroidota bacterium]